MLNILKLGHVSGQRVSTYWALSLVRWAHKGIKLTQSAGICVRMVLREDEGHT